MAPLTCSRELQRPRSGPARCCERPISAVLAEPANELAGAASDDQQERTYVRSAYAVGCLPGGHASPAGSTLVDP